MVKGILIEGYDIYSNVFFLNFFLKNENKLN